MSLNSTSNPAVHVPRAHSVLRKDAQNPVLPLDSNGSADFDEFTTGCIFEDAVEDYLDQDKFFSADASPESAAFWLNDAEYYHHESVVCCVNGALRSNTTRIDDFLGVNSIDPLDIQENNIYAVHELEFLANGSPRIHTPSAVDYENMRFYFAWQPTAIIEATFKNSTQYGFMRSSSNGNLFMRYKSPNPGANHHCIYDGFLTDSICSDIPAIDGGETLGQC